ncbi:MAG TPA: hypothetical protein DCQ30_01030, partial [Acidimicrobiaceae bacterium]|nr:hypothetical protein [Acidimicrobiaceae bacterium]
MHERGSKGARACSAAVGALRLLFVGMVVVVVLVALPWVVEEVAPGAGAAGWGGLTVRPVPVTTDTSAPAAGVPTARTAGPD